MRMLTKKQLMAIENMNLIMAAKRSGLAVFREDLLINYAEISIILEQLEQDWAAAAGSQVAKILEKWASGIHSREDLKKKMHLADPLQLLIMDFIRSVWDYGQGTADEELQGLEMGEFAGGKAGTNSLTNTDAFEWYSLYTRALSNQGEDAAFTYMQPLILEKLDEGTVGTELADALASDFRRYGQVRTQIIARTESNKAFNWGRRYRFDQSAAVAGYRYSAIIDERTTEICNYLHGFSWAIDDPGLDVHTPPNHFQCRSILVAISKYVNFTFDPPPSGWEASLPANERKVFDKFKDSTFYPKASTVKSKAAPKMDKPKKKAAVKKAKGTRKKPQKENKETERLVELMIEQSNFATARNIKEYLDHNLRRGVNPNHPGMKSAENIMHDIQDGMYQGKMINAEWNSRKSIYELHEYERMGNLFWRQASAQIKAADRKRMLAEVSEVAEDPLFMGVKIELIKSDAIAGSYSAKTDVMKYEVGASSTSKRQSVDAGHLGTLYHEIGHRVHNTPSMYNSKYVPVLQEAGINISDKEWQEWMGVVEPYWEASRTQPGSKLLPDDLYLRYDYPINAKFYYKKGNKDNFYKEMFAETTSVYLEGNLKEFMKVDRTYPGLLAFFEKVYKRGIYDPEKLMKGVK